MNKPPFDPKQPYTPVDKPKFDPGQPFQPASASPAPETPAEPPNSLVQGASDLASGVLNGATLGGADIIGAGLNAASDVGLSGLAAAASGDEKSQKELKDLYRKYQQYFSGKTKEAEERSPILSGVGNLAGTVAPAILTGGLGALGEAAGASALKTAAPELAGSALESLAAKAGSSAVQGATLGATQGALTSKNNLIGASDDEAGKFGQDIQSGALTGGILGAGMRAAGELGGKALGAGAEYLSSKVEDSPLLTQTQKAYEMGKQGINLGSRTQQVQDLYQRGLNDTQDLLGKINRVDNMLGSRVGDALANAEQQGITVDIGDNVKSVAKQIANYAQQNPAISLDPTSENIFKKVLGSGEELKPNELLTLRDSVDNILDNMKGDNTTLTNAARKLISGFRKDITDSLGEAIPEYQEASQRFNQFRKLVPETIIGKGLPSDISGVRLGSLSNPDLKLQQGLQDIIEGSELPGSSTAQAKTTIGSLAKNLHDLENIDGLEGRGQDDSIFGPKGLGMTSDDFLQKIRDASDTSAVIKQATGTNPQEGPASLMKTVALGGTTGRGKMLGVANLAGRAVNAIAPIESTSATSSVVGNLSRNLYNSPNSVLQGVADKLSTNPTTAHLGTALSTALKENNPANRNAALFIIMQNPNARLFLDGGEKSTEPTNLNR